MRSCLIFVVFAALLCGCGSRSEKWEFETVSFPDASNTKVVFHLSDGDKIEPAGSLEGALDILNRHGWEVVAVSRDKGQVTYQIKHRDPVGDDKFSLR